MGEEIGRIRKETGEEIMIRIHWMIFQEFFLNKEKQKENEGQMETANIFAKFWIFSIIQKAHILKAWSSAWEQNNGSTLSCWA